MFNILFSYEDEDIGRFSNLYQCTITYYVQKQPPEVFYKKGVLRNFAKFTGKHLCHSLFFNKVARLRYATLLKRDSGTTEDKNEKIDISKGLFQNSPEQFPRKPHLVEFCHLRNKQNKSMYQDIVYQHLFGESG